MLVDRAFRNRRDAAAQFLDADLPLMMAGAASAHNDRTLREVSFG
jgi:flagellar biosynthesis protein FlhF